MNFPVPSALFTFYLLLCTLFRYFFDNHASGTLHPNSYNDATMNDEKKLWETVLIEIELVVSKATFNTWFKQTYISRIDDGTVYVSVPNLFVKDWLQNKYHKNILKSLREKVDSIRAIHYIINPQGSEKKQSTQKSIPNPTQELPLPEVYINREDNLNPRYTFDSFIIGSFNELAHAAAQAVIKKPGQVYNPFFVYGSTGRGKTHLIQAIGNHIKTSFPNKKVYYLTSEKFTMEFVSAVQNNKTGVFKEKYRKYDVVIMDDIQFMANKVATQEELFHLFNYYHDNNKQVVFSSDQHPNFIPNLEDRLKSRFGSGMIVDIPQPDLESRIAILNAKAKQHELVLSQEIIEYLASSVEGNIRELEGVLNGIICQIQLKKRDLSLPEIKNILKNTNKPKKNVAIKDIVKMVADFYNIDEKSIYDKTRKKEVVRPRQVAMYILREDCSVSYPSIGQKLGGRDHTTVIHSCEKIKTDIKDDPVLSQEINQIRNML